MRHGKRAAQVSPVVGERRLVESIREDAIRRSHERRDLGRSQGAALERATSSYLRAEADLLDASRVADLGVRRAAMERRFFAGALITPHIVPAGTSRTCFCPN